MKRERTLWRESRSGWTLRSPDPWTLVYLTRTATNYPISMWYPYAHKCRTGARSLFDSRPPAHDATRGFWSRKPPDATRKRHKNTEKTPTGGLWWSILARDGYHVLPGQSAYTASTSTFAFALRPVRPPPPPRVPTRQCEDCWRCTTALVTTDDLVSPSDRVAAARPRDRPQLEVLGRIVVTNAVPMMNRFAIMQVPLQ